MGNRLHVATKYDVEWSSGSFFNWKIGEFHDFMDTLEVEYSGDTYDADFEVDKKSWKDALKKLKNFDNLSEEEREEIQEGLNVLECTLDEAIDGFEYLYKNSSKGDYMYLSFF